MNNFLNADIRLVKAGEASELLERHQPLIFLYWKDFVAVFEEPTIFIFENLVQSDKTPSPHSWEAAGYDLITWFKWCQAKRIDWHDATETDGKRFAGDAAASNEPKTINRKLRIVRRFYDYARDQGWYQRDIGTEIEGIPSVVIH